MKTINEMLANENFTVEKTTVNRNGVDVVGVMFCFKDEEEVCPIWYPEDSFWDLSDEEKAVELKHAAGRFDLNNPDVQEIKDILYSEDVLDHVYPSLISEDNIEACRKAGTVVVQDESSGLGIIFKLRSSSVAATIKKSMLPAFGIDESALRSLAFENAEKEDFNIKSLSEIMMGEIGSIANDPTLVVSNKKLTCGSYAILTKKVQNMISDRLGRNDYIVIPSSVHEVLVVNPDGFDFNVDQLSHLIQNVNENECEDCDVLGSTPYFMRDGMLMKGLPEAAA